MKQVGKGLMIGSVIYAVDSYRYKQTMKGFENRQAEMRKLNEKETERELRHIERTNEMYMEINRLEAEIQKRVKELEEYMAGI